MSPRTSNQLEELKAGKRMQIMDAALKVFSEYGYKGATMSLIAQKANISKGLTYTYFKSKEELLDELLIYGLNRFNAYISFIPEKGINTKKEFEAVLRGIVELYNREQDFWRLYIMIILQKNITRKFEQMIQGFVQQYLEIFVAYFHKKKAANPMAEAMLFGATLDGMMFDMIVAPDLFPIEDIIQLLIKKFA